MHLLLNKYTRNIYWHLVSKWKWPVDFWTWTRMKSAVPVWCNTNSHRQVAVLAGEMRGYAEEEMRKYPPMSTLESWVFESVFKRQFLKTEFIFGTWMLPTACDSLVSSSRCSWILCVVLLEEANVWHVHVCVIFVFSSFVRRNGTGTVCGHHALSGQRRRREGPEESPVQP